MKICKFCDSYNAKKRMSVELHKPFENQGIDLSYTYTVALIETVYKKVNGRKRKASTYTSREYKLRHCPCCGKEIGKIGN